MLYARARAAVHAEISLSGCGVAGGEGGLEGQRGTQARARAEADDLELEQVTRVHRVFFLIANLEWL